MSLDSGVLPVGGATSVRLEYLPPLTRIAWPSAAHPPFVEEGGGVRPRRALEQAASAELGRHAFGREYVVGRLALQLGAPGDVVVLQEAGATFAALEHLGDDLRRLHAQRLGGGQRPSPGPSRDAWPACRCAARRRRWRLEKNTRRPFMAALPRSAQVDGRS